MANPGSAWLVIPCSALKGACPSAPAAAAYIPCTSASEKEDSSFPSCRMVHTRWSTAARVDGFPQRSLSSRNSLQDWQARG